MDIKVDILKTINKINNQAVKSNLLGIDYYKSIEYETAYDELIDTCISKHKETIKEIVHDIERNVEESLTTFTLDKESEVGQNKSRLKAASNINKKIRLLVEDVIRSKIRFRTGVPRSIAYDNLKLNKYLGRVLQTIDDNNIVMIDWTSTPSITLKINNSTAINKCTISATLKVNIGFTNGMYSEVKIIVYGNNENADDVNHILNTDIVDQFKELENFIKILKNKAINKVSSINGYTISKNKEIYINTMDMTDDNEEDDEEYWT